jgi:hypothetical protein
MTAKAPKAQLIEFVMGPTMDGPNEWRRFLWEYFDCFEVSCSACEYKKTVYAHLDPTGSQYPPWELINCFVNLISPACPECGAKPLKLRKLKSEPPTWGGSPIVIEEDDEL